MQMQLLCLKKVHCKLSTMKIVFTEFYRF